MSIPPTKAEIDAALATPANANALLDDIRKTITDPSVIYPEMFGAVEVSRTNLPTHDPTTTVANDTTALQACMTQLTTKGGTLLLRRKYGISTGLLLEGTRESALDGQRIIGTGTPYSCGLVMTGNNYNALELKGNDPSGAVRKPIHFSLENFGITGGTNSGKGIYGHNSLGGSRTDVSNGLFSRLRILTGGDAIHLGVSFQLIFQLCKVGSYKGHGFNLDGSNSTTLQTCYAMKAGDGKAGYRIIGGSPVSMTACTGVDEAGCSWAAFGTLHNITGTTIAGGTTSRIKISASEGAATGLYDMLEFEVTSGAQSGFKGTISKHVKNDYLDLSVNTPLPSALASGVTYKIQDAEGRYRNQGDPYSKDARITLNDCNLESFSRTGIKTFRAGLLTIQNALFFIDPSVTTTHDCCIYLNEGNGTYNTKITASRVDVVSRNAGYPAEFIQGKGSEPAMMAERMDPTLRTIYSQESGAALRMLHVDPYGITLPTGFPTSNPGPGKLWSDGGTLKVGT